jgi:primosomal protein N''
MDNDIGVQTTPPNGSAVARIRLEGAPFHVDRIYEYSVPEPLQTNISVGDFVIVPFGASNRRMLGVVTGLSDTSETASERLKVIYELRPAEYRLTSEQMALCDFLCAHAFCTFGDALGAVVPSAAIKGLEKHESPSNVKRNELLQLSVLATDAKVLEKSLKSDIQRSIINELASSSDPVTTAELCSKLGITRAKLVPLIKRRLIESAVVDITRDPYAPDGTETPPDGNILTGEQAYAAKQLCELADTGEPHAALLFGVTGSGKTRVIKAVIDNVTASGRQVIVLVPEIALTPQTVGLFRAFYGGRIAVLHSQLSSGERFDAWRRIRSGEADICIGTRSAVFAPCPNLGLIVIDEEQEHTYKSDMSPKYHARDVARFRCGRNGALLLLASATPSVESFSRAQKGIYKLVELTRRYGDATLPEGVVVDMRRTAKTGRGGFISERLYTELAKRLERGEQSILFVNRRGYNNFLSCPKCGEVVMCPNCSVSLTYHAPERNNADSRGRLVCHYCGFMQSPPDACPKCGFGTLSHVGYGTQRAEERLRELFPVARIVRMDADTTRGKFAHEELLSSFRNGSADILIGTQMVTKGHDFPNVTLVGVLDADGALYMGDYRASERAFALITQVVGRAGRADKPGMALVQTYSPDHAIIKLAAAQNYFAMYEDEIALRRARGFPPFCDMVSLTLQSKSEPELNSAAVMVDKRLRELRLGEFADLELTVFGPVEATVYKLDGTYRLRYIIKCRIGSRTRLFVRTLLDALPSSQARKVSLSADVNPTEL